MSEELPEESLDQLKARAEQDRFNSALRFELGKRLCREGEYQEAIPHLQAATGNPHLRQEVLKFLSLAFKELGMGDLDTKL